MLPHYIAEKVEFIEKRKKRIDGWARTDNGWVQVETPPKAVTLIEKGEGSLSGCLRNLKILHAEIADYVWFAEQDLSTFKLHSYVISRLMYIIAETDGSDFIHEATWFYPLLSDHEPMIRYWIDWMLHKTPDSKLCMQRVVNPNQNEYRYYQVTLALAGQWNTLGRKAEVFLQALPAKMKKYAPDMRFYLALAQKDKAGMENALDELTSPKVAKIRNQVFELPVAERFVSPFACVYAKVASRWGFALDVDTVLIPQEWLPVSPLPSYPDPYAFMRKWEIES
ncbi:Imm49 family immunity protein [Comamonas odontotermitis]|uniref:Imm49 family immunity protein n=1 Tax=Comamonas odontotermitis TaxID=379895 RepID=UPI003750158D